MQLYPYLEISQAVRVSERRLKDPLKSHKPETPHDRTSFGGRVGASNLIKETWMEEDPREAILKFADFAAKDPKYIAPAYARNSFCKIRLREMI